MRGRSTPRRRASQIGRHQPSWLAVEAGAGCVARSVMRTSAYSMPLQAGGHRAGSNPPVNPADDDGRHQAL